MEHKGACVLYKIGGRENIRTESMEVPTLRTQQFPMWRWLFNVIRIFRRHEEYCESYET